MTGHRDNLRYYVMAIYEDLAATCLFPQPLEVTFPLSGVCLVSVLVWGSHPQRRPVKNDEDKFWKGLFT